MTHPLGSSPGSSRAHFAPTARFAALAAIAAVLATGAGLVFAQPAGNKPKADPRVQTLATDGETVIDLAVQRGQLTHVVLPLGENFTLPPATGQGARCDDENHAWCIVAQGRDLFIKAKPAAKTNNLILVTEKRRFAIDLRAVDRGGLMRLTLMPPKASEPAGHATAQAALPGKAMPVASPAPDPQRLLQERLAAAPMPRNTQYSMAVGQSSDDITPSMVFDDGRFTYLKFPGNRPLPAIFQTAADGSEETVNVRMGEDDLLVADRVARRLVLRLGQAVVIVVNDGFDLEGQPPVEGTTVPGVSRTLSQVPRAAPRSVPSPVPSSSTVQGIPVPAGPQAPAKTVASAGAAAVPAAASSALPAPVPAPVPATADAAAGGAP